MIRTSFDDQSHCAAPSSSLSVLHVSRVLLIYILYSSSIGDGLLKWSIANVVDAA